MTFILQYGQTETARYEKGMGWRTTLPDDRDFIDDHLHKGNRQLATEEADSWEEARVRLGGWT